MRVRLVYQIHGRLLPEYRGVDQQRLQKAARCAAQIISGLFGRMPILGEDERPATERQQVIAEKILDNFIQFVPFPVFLL